MDSSTAQRIIQSKLPLQAEGKKLALDHFVFAASRENYSEIAANCGVNLGLNKTSPAGDDRTSRLYSSLVSEVSQDSAKGPGVIQLTSSWISSSTC